MTEMFRFLSIDRIEPRRSAPPQVIFCDDEGRTFTVDAAQLPMRPSEGAVLRVRYADGEPEWATALRDQAEEQRRLDALAAQRARLIREDPGGDLAL